MPREPSAQEGRWRAPQEGRRQAPLELVAPLEHRACELVHEIGGLIPVDDDLIPKRRREDGCVDPLVDPGWHLEPGIRGLRSDDGVDLLWSERDENHVPGHADLDDRGHAAHSD